MAIQEWAWGRVCLKLILEPKYTAIVMNYTVSNFPGLKTTLKFLSPYNDHELVTLSADQMQDLFENACC